MTTYTQALDVLHTWIDAVNSGDLAPILTLYADNATLLPTFSPHVADSPAKVESYYIQLASRRNMSVSLHEKTVHSIHIKDGIHAIYGIYHFSFEIDEDLMSFASRFTFVVDLNSEQPIMHHHSSQVPRTLN